MSSGERPFALKCFFKSAERLAVKIKQRLIVSYLLDRVGGMELIRRYAEMPPPCCPIAADSPVWTCWWQGEENMPDIVRVCYNAMCQFAGGHSVVLVTKKNYRDYVDMPDYIIQKLRSGAISLTHLSDILRVMLLKRYGGIWMDCTLLVPAKRIDTFISVGESFWSCHHHPVYYNISQGGWVSFFFACGPGNHLPAFMADLFLAYWKKHDRLMEYLLVDYAFALARKGIPSVREMIERVPITEMGPLGKCLNEAYTEERWQEFCTRYDFHKLTYKIPLRTTTSEGRKTFYGHILESFL